MDLKTPSEVLDKYARNQKIRDAFVQAYGQFLKCTEGHTDGCPEPSGGWPAYKVERARSVGRLLLPLSSFPLTDNELSMVLQLLLWDHTSRDDTVPYEELVLNRELSWELTRSMRWAQYNFPSVRLTAPQSCALALSDLTEEQLTGVEAPWPYFVLYTDDSFVADDVRANVTFVGRPSSPQHGPTWLEEVLLSTGETLSYGDLTASSFYKGAGSLLMEETDAVGPPLKRVQQLLCRTILNLCDVLQTSQAVLRPAKDRLPGGKKRPVVGKGLIYDVGLPVKVDMRAHVRDYLSSNVARVYKVRWVVRGHRRCQAHGPGMALRKPIWVEPYWKGPEKGTKLVREHQVSDALVGLPEEKERCQTTAETTPRAGAVTLQEGQR